VTIHRRENFNQIEHWFKEIDKLAENNKHIEFLLPIHPNPEIKKFKSIFKYVKVVEPMNHSDLINYLKDCKLCITDSGGLQEESSFLKKKVIVCRKTTERTETVGVSSFICKDPKELETLFNQLILDYNCEYDCPFGDGSSTDKIIKIIENLKK
jgi:UDP-N-acetylglucosamine 2-epimerase (non-hydrolysing)